MTPRLFFGLLFSLLAASFSATAGTGFTDQSPDPGVQDATWPEPSVITVYIPKELTGADRINFEMGIQIWLRCLPKISVKFVDGEPPGLLGVDVTICPPGTVLVNGVPRPGATDPRAGGPSHPPTTPGGPTHYTMKGAQIKLDSDDLGNPDFMKNLGAHEFGHALGLDDNDDRPAGANRSNVMDSQFDSSDPFVSPSQEEMKALETYYTVVCVPETGPLLSGSLIFGMGVAAFISRARKSK